VSIRYWILENRENSKNENSIHCYENCTSSELENTKD
jgi:hypothetical protein